MKIGLTQIVKGDLSPEEFLRFAKRTGYESVELSVGPGVLDEDSACEKVKALAGELELELSSAIVMGADCGNLLSPIEEERKKRLDTLREAIRVANRLGVDTTLLHPGQLGPEARYDKSWTWLMEGLREVAEEAKEANVVVALEHVWNKFILSPTEMRDFIDEVGDPFVKVYLDTGNMVTYGYPEHWIEILADRIQKVHFKDFRRSDHQFVPLMEGDVDWPKVMAAFRSIGYDDAVISECGGDEAEHRDTAERMRKIIAM